MKTIKVNKKDIQLGWECVLLNFNEFSMSYAANLNDAQWEEIMYAAFVLMKEQFVSLKNTKKTKNKIKNFRVIKDQITKIT